MNQKIVAALALIAILLSALNFALLLSNSLFASSKQSIQSANTLYVANVTRLGTMELFNETFYDIFIVNPSEDITWFYYSACFIGKTQKLYHIQEPFIKIDPFETRRLSLQYKDSQLVKAEITIFDANKGFVYDKTLDIIPHPLLETP